jgi:methyl-accepting chemotaxis protein
VTPARLPSLSIAAKIGAVAGISAVAAVAVVVIALMSLGAMIRDYQALLERDRVLLDSARRMQVVFKIQVQEWKNILLRGRDSADLAKYSAAFFEREAEVADLAATLAAVVEDSVVVDLVTTFAENHRTLGERYRGALALFEAGPDDPYRADRSVRGMDRQPTDEVDAIVAEIDRLVDARAADLEASLNQRRLVIAVLAVVALGLSAALAWWVGTRISRPLAVAAGTLTAAADGDLTLRLGLVSDDEVGRIGRAADHLLDALEGAIAEIAASSGALADASDRLLAASNVLGSAAQQTSQQARVVAAAADQIAGNVGTVATGAEQLTASIREIARNAAEAGAVAGTAAETSEHARETIGRLSGSGAEIGAVVTFIDAVADQTSLLALNATIEAARAGDAGRGFAVVADEVKSLARQTGGAIEGIKSRVAAIQTDARASVDAIGAITEIVRREHEIAAAIAGAVEEQTATTAEISASSSDAAAAAADIAASIANVAEGASLTSDGIADVIASARRLSDLTGRLGERVGRFRIGERSAQGRS